MVMDFHYWNEDIVPIAPSLEKYKCNMFYSKSLSYKNLYKSYEYCTLEYFCAGNKRTNQSNYYLEYLFD